MGGHTEVFLEKGASVYAFEWDEESLRIATERLRGYGERIKVYPYNFTYIKEVLQKEGVYADGVLLDLGLSSFLLEGSGRGFTFQKNEPLDMRMSQELTLTARDLLNRLSEEELGNVFYKGEVPKARCFAKWLCKKRKIKPLNTTFDLVDRIREFYKPPKKKEKDLFALVFQAIRIEVNQELKNLELALKNLPDILKPGGRIAVISFHSLEDRLVKRFFKKDERLALLTKKPVRPSQEEVRENPRARSAKLRVAERRI